MEIKKKNLLAELDKFEKKDQLPGTSSSEINDDDENEDQIELDLSSIVGKLELIALHLEYLNLIILR